MRLQRPLWHHYFTNTQALVFVVDSCDAQRIDVVKKVLHSALESEQLANTVLLVLANKQDLPSSLTCEQITEQLDLKSLTNRTWSKSQNMGPPLVCILK